MRNIKGRYNVSLRPYQQEALKEIGKHFARGTRRVLLVLATGGGKTHIFSQVLKGSASKGNRSAMAVRGRQLVDQASKRLLREGVPHGVRMAKHWNQNHSSNVQICSIDTLLSRQEFPEAKILVIDEAHLFTSEGCKKFIDQYPDAFILAVTATPYTKEELTHLADVIVKPITVQELTDQGYLVPLRYYAPSTPDLKGVKIQRGEFVADQLEQRMSALTGDLPSHWIQLAQDRPTLGFAVNIRHSLALTDQFNAAGIPAEHIEGLHSFEERAAAFRRLELGHIKVLFNVGVACTGVDLPFLSAILLARPTKSYNLYVQQMGRGTRICTETGKKDCIILDHAGNVLRHGLMVDEPEIVLEGVKVEPRGPIPNYCESCFAIFTGPFCHACGAEKVIPPSANKKEIELEVGILKELEGLPMAAEISLFIRRKKELAKRRGYKKGWVWHQTVEKYGEEIANIAIPRRKLPPWLVR
jgi:DNA repair protein RadD